MVPGLRQSSNWQELIEAEKKAKLEAALEAALDEIERAGREPSQWESEHLFRAIHAAMDGWFDLSAEHLERVNADDPKTPPALGWSPTAGLGNLAVGMLRVELNRLRNRPLKEKP